MRKVGSIGFRITDIQTLRQLTQPQQSQLKERIRLQIKALTNDHVEALYRNRSPMAIDDLGNSPIRDVDTLVREALDAANGRVKSPGLEFVVCSEAGCRHLDGQHHDHFAFDLKIPGVKGSGRPWVIQQRFTTSRGKSVTISAKVVLELGWTISA